MTTLFVVIWIGLLRLATAVTLRMTDGPNLTINETILLLNSTEAIMANVKSVCGNGPLRNGEDYLVQLLNGSGCQHALPYFIRCSDYSYRMFESQCVGVKIAYMIACGILGILITVGNLLVIIVFLKAKKLRNSQGIYKLSIAFTDLIFGIFIPPSVIITWQGGWQNVAYLSALGFVTPFTTFSSMGVLIASGIDRLFAISLSVRYRPWTAKRYAYVIVAFVWCISACISSLPFFLDSVWFTYASTGTLKLLAGEPVIVVCLAVAISAVFLNGIILFLIVKFREREAAKIWSNHISSRDKQLAITLCIMILAFTSSTLPGMVLLTVNDVNTAPLLIGEAFVVFLFLTNGLWNCIVYSYRHEEFRDELKNICRLPRQKSSIFVLRRTI